MNKKEVGIWIRVSTDFQVKEDSPEHHEKRARLYAEAKGWTVVEVYRLDAISGKSVMERPETKRMLHDLKTGHIEALIFSKLARLARNTKELLEFSELFREYNADLISLSENIDTSSPAGRLFYTMIAAMAEWERGEIAERVAASVPIRAKLGKPLGGQAPFGYQWVENKVIIDEKEAPIRKLMYDLFLKYQRKKSTASELNQLGYRTRNGSKFSGTTISRLLRDPMAKGERRANYTKSTGEGKKWELKPASEWVMMECPAIVTEETWSKCNELLDEQEQKNKRPGPRAVHLLSGFVTCHCGKKMYVFHSSRVYTCRACKNRIAVDDIDEIFQMQLKAFLTDANLTHYQEQSDIELQEKEHLLKVSKAEKQKLGKKMEDLIELRLSGEMAKETFAIHFKPIEERALQLENQIPELEADIDFRKIQSLSSETVLQDAKDLYEQWPTFPFDQKRAIIEIITEKIIIEPQDITISLAYLPQPPSFLNQGKRERNSMDSYWRST